MAWYSEMSFHMLSIRTGTALVRLANFYDFTSKPAKNQPKLAQNTRNVAMEFCLKNQDKAFKHHYYHFIVIYPQKGLTAVLGSWLH